MHTARLTELKKRRQKQQKRSLILTAGAAAVLVVGGLLAFLLLRGRQSDGVIPLGANVIPQNALLSLTVPTDSGPWRQLSGLGTAETQKALQDRLKSFESDFLTPFTLSFDKDIRPWVGSQATLTLLSPAPEDVARVGANATVWLLPLRDPQQAQATLTRLAGASPRTRTYKDVPIQILQGADNKVMAVAIIENRLLAASNGEMTLNQVIDTYRGAASLAQTPRLQEAMSTVQADSPFGQVYINLPMATAGLLQDSGRNLSKSSLDRLQGIQGLGSTVSLTGDGLSFKAVSWLKPDAKTKLNPTSQSYTLPRLLPSDTVLMSAGGSFQQLWQDYTQGTESQLVVPFNPSKIQSGLKNSLGIDFEKDFVSWMNGEFVVAVLPTSDKVKQGVGITLLAKASDRSQANQSFQKLDTALRDRYNFLIAESKVKDRTVTIWKVPPNLPLASHGWLDNNVAFFTFGAPITDRITGAVDSPLTDAALFKSATQTSLSLNSGEFYSDIQRTTALMQNSPLLPKLSPTVLQFTQGIDGLGVTSAVQNEWSTRYDMTVKLKR
jgi:Protein of unknown function (DUF3352)